MGVTYLHLKGRNPKCTSCNYITLIGSESFITFYTSMLLTPIVQKSETWVQVLIQSLSLSLPLALTLNPSSLSSPIIQLFIHSHNVLVTVLGAKDTQ